MLTGISHLSLMRLANNRKLSGYAINASTRDTASARIKRSTTGRLVRLAAIIALASALAGCGKSGASAKSTGDPELDARLAQLTRDLHHTMAGRKINRDFGEFVALANLDVPPPPPGKKYSINEKWKVVLVDQ